MVTYCGKQQHFNLFTGFYSIIVLIQETTPNVINWQDYEGRSALHLAVADGNEAVVNALVGNKIEKRTISTPTFSFRNKKV